MVQVSFTLPLAARQGRRGRRRPAGQQDGHGPGARRARQGDGARTSPSSSSTAGCTTSSTPRKVEVVERDYALLTPKEVNAAVKRALRRRLVVVGGCIGTDAHTVGIDAILNIKGFAGEKGLEYYRELKVVNLGAQVSVPQLVERRGGGEGRRRAGLPGRHPARRPPAQHPRDVGRVPRGVPAGTSAAAGGRRAALRRDAWPATSASTGSSPGARRPVRSPASWCTGSSTRSRRAS